MATFTEFRAEVDRVLRLAESLYGVDLSRVVVRTAKRGKVAGMASMRRSTGYMELNFNAAGIRDHWDYLHDNTIPHEVAHLVTYLRPDLGNKHDHGWRRICLELGGNGNRCHSLPLKYANGSYYYRTTTGHIIEMSNIRHRKIQFEGGEYRCRGKGLIKKDGYIGQQHPDEAPLAVAAQAPAPQTRTPSPARQKQSKAGLMRAKMRQLQAEGKNPTMYYESLVQYGMQIGFGTIGAARSCVKANLRKI